jgi:hypothetical protein
VTLLPRKPTFNIGDRVRVRGHREVARIESFYLNVEGGVRLDRYISPQHKWPFSPGFKSWNVADLVKA